MTVKLYLPRHYADADEMEETLPTAKAEATSDHGIVLVVENAAVSAASWSRAWP